MRTIDLTVSEHTPEGDIVEELFSGILECLLRDKEYYGRLCNNEAQHELELYLTALDLVAFFEIIQSLLNPTERNKEGLRMLRRKAGLYTKEEVVEVVNDVVKISQTSYNDGDFILEVCTFIFYHPWTIRWLSLMPLASQLRFITEQDDFKVVVGQEHEDLYSEDNLPIENRQMIALLSSKKSPFNLLLRFNKQGYFYIPVK